VVVTGVQFLPVKRSDWLATGFLQDEIQVIPERLTFTLGTKLLRTNFTGVAPEPSGRVAWTPSDKSTLWASYTHALRTPSDGEENFYLASYINTAPSGLMTFARFNPNTSFAPEQLNGYEAGYRRLLRQNLYVDVASFMNRYHNLFSEEFAGPAYLETDFAPLHLLIPLQFRNGLYGKTAGYEISPEWRPKEGWRLRGSWSYLQMHLHPAPGSGDLGTWPTIEGSSPRNQIELESDYDVSKTVQFDVQYRFISALPAEKVAAYSSMDARLGWRIRPAVDVSLVGQNLLQPWHVESDGDVNTLVGIGRSGYIRLTWMH
jgi:iron complex outermembrane receptor protein